MAQQSRRGSGDERGAKRSGFGAEVEDAAEDGSGLVFAELSRSEHEAVGHAGMEQQLAALGADVGAHGDDRDVVSLPDEALDVAIVGERSPAARADAHARLSFLSC